MESLLSAQIFGQYFKSPKSLFEISERLSPLITEYFSESFWLAIIFHSSSVMGLSRLAKEEAACSGVSLEWASLGEKQMLHPRKTSKVR